MHEAHDVRLPDYVGELLKYYYCNLLLFLQGSKAQGFCQL